MVSTSRNPKLGKARTEVTYDTDVFLFLKMHFHTAFSTYTHTYIYTIHASVE